MAIGEGYCPGALAPRRVRRARGAPRRCGVRRGGSRVQLEVAVDERVDRPAARRAPAPRRAPARVAGRSIAARSASASAAGSPGRDERRVARGRLAVAVDVRRDDRGAAPPSPSSGTSPKLSPPSDGTQSDVGPAEARELLVVVARAEPLDARVGAEAPLERLGLRSVAEHPAVDRQVEARHRLEQDAEALALLVAPDEERSSARSVGVGAAASTRSSSTPLNSTSVSRPARARDGAGGVLRSPRRRRRGRARAAGSRARRARRPVRRRRGGTSPTVGRRCCAAGSRRRRPGRTARGRGRPRRAAWRRSRRTSSTRRAESVTGAREPFAGTLTTSPTAACATPAATRPASTVARRADDDVDAAPREVPGHRAHLGLDPAGHAERVGADERRRARSARSRRGGPVRLQHVPLLGRAPDQPAELVGDEPG